MSSRTGYPRAGARDLGLALTWRLSEISRSARNDMAFTYLAMRCSVALHVQIRDLTGMSLDKALAGRHRAAHEHIEGFVGPNGVFDRNLQ